MIPFFIYYSMFGFQRIGDLIWAAADCRAKGFLIGGTAGRTTLNGEGLQHQDGHSLLNAIAFPTVRAYDPAFHYETAVIVFDGLKRLYEQGETAIYYLSVENENYEMPAMPAGCEEGIVRGIYRVTQEDQVQKPVARVQLFGKRCHPPVCPRGTASPCGTVSGSRPTCGASRATANFAGMLKRVHDGIASILSNLRAAPTSSMSSKVKPAPSLPSRTMCARLPNKWHLGYLAGTPC